ncbi:hypothetical protein ANN_15492 [Periplaneta americana]|uniref:Transposase n=1 Tax=Periplaneta americana TaxID=6978 RepID=A0ABQ8SH79_PERAM|nr:hypothetical protein ANN_15492 [Periplaneta americana]
MAERLVSLTPNPAVPGSIPSQDELSGLLEENVHDHPDTIIHIIDESSDDDAEDNIEFDDEVFDSDKNPEKYWEEYAAHGEKHNNTELHALYSSSDIIRNIKSRRLGWAGYVARMGGSRNAYRVLVGRPEEERPLGRPRRRWEDNIKMDLREVVYDGAKILENRCCRPKVSNDFVEQTQELFTLSPVKSTRRVSYEFRIPRTIHKGLGKSLRIGAYNVQIGLLQPGESIKRRNFSERILDRIDDDVKFVKRIVFCDETAILISNKVQIHCVRMWSTLNPYSTDV